jgi:hypothetical protein
LNWNRRDWLFAFAALVLVSIYTIRAGGGYPLDDSWIHQTYGRNLALYGEWAFLPGTPSAASTSPLYTVLLAIGYRIGVPYVLWTAFLGISALTGIAVFGARIAERMLPEDRRAGWITGSALMLSWHLIWAASSGMETALFSMLIIALILLSWWQVEQLPDWTTVRAGQLGFLFGILAACTTLARPEGILAAGMAGLALFVATFRKYPAIVLVWGISASVGFLLAMSPYLALNLQLTGGLLPNTANAKFVQHAVTLGFPYPYRFYKLSEAILAGGQILLVPGIVIYGWLIVRRMPVQKILLGMLPLLWAVGLIAVYAARLPAWYQHGRYVIPALPALIICGAIGMLWLFRRIPAHARSLSALLVRVGVRTLMVSTALLFVIFAAWGVEIFRTDVTIIDSEMVAAAYWIDENLPPDELLAIHDIGAVGYFSPRPMLDIAGLVSPEVIDALDDPEQMWNLMQERDARYLMAFADQVPGRNVNDPRLCPIYSTGAEITLLAGGTNMTIYRLSWDATCDD